MRHFQDNLAVCFSPFSLVFDAVVIINLNNYIKHEKKERKKEGKEKLQIWFFFSHLFETAKQLEDHLMEIGRGRAKKSRRKKKRRGEREGRKTISLKIKYRGIFFFFASD